MSRTPLKPHDELTIAAALLSRAAPNKWEEFVASFKKVADERLLEVMKAPADQVFVAQGYARAYAEISNQLVNAIAEAERLTRQQKPQ